MKKYILTLLALYAAMGMYIFNVATEELPEPVQVKMEEITYVEETHAVVSSSLPVVFQSEAPIIKSKMIEMDESESDIVVEEMKLTDEEVDLIALVTMAEAEGESEKGKRLVIDTILNRVDSELRYFPDTVHDVVYQKNAFTSMWNGRVDRCYVDEDIRTLVLEELESRTNYEVMYFCAGDYSAYGTPMFPVGNHYFSSN